MFDNNSIEFNNLIDLLKDKVNDNTTYYIVMSDFSKDGFDVYKRAMLIPSILGGDTDNVVLSVIYKVLPKDIDSIADIEGIININYSDLASLIIADKIVPRYTEANKVDEDIKKLVDIIKQH